MKIVVQGHTIETTEIYDIVDISDSWQVGFKICLIDKPDLVIGRNIDYDCSPDRRHSIEYPYERLMKEVKAKWEEDKTTLPIYKL